MKTPIGPASSNALPQWARCASIFEPLAPIEMNRYIVILSLIFFSCRDQKGNNNIERIDEIKTSINTNLKMDTINTDNFWRVINQAVKVSGGNNKVKEEYLVSELAKLSHNEIKQFEVAFRKCVIDADDYKIMGAQKIIEGYVSDDSYLYFRCWLIGQGQEVYSEVLSNPDNLANIISKRGTYEFEGLMYVATKAYSIKTGQEEDETFPRAYAYDLGLDYNFGAPPTKGTDWNKNDLPKLYPKLWNKVN